MKADVAEIAVVKFHGQRAYLKVFAQRIGF
jgi:hypothetical protein